MLGYLHVGRSVPVWNFGIVPVNMRIPLQESARCKVGGIESTFFGLEIVNAAEIDHCLAGLVDIDDCGKSFAEHYLVCAVRRPRMDRLRKRFVKPLEQYKKLGFGRDELRCGHPMQWACFCYRMHDSPAQIKKIYPRPFERELVKSPHPLACHILDEREVNFGLDFDELAQRLEAYKEMESQSLEKYLCECKAR